MLGTVWTTAERIRRGGAWRAALLAGVFLAGIVPGLSAQTSRAQAADWTFKHDVIDPAPPATYRMNDLQIGDIDGDGLPDIWATGRGAGNSVYQMVWYKNPAWTRYEIAPGDFKYGNLGDLDGDGDLDVVAGKAWFENTGHPEQRDWPRHDFGFRDEPDLMHVGDLNADGRLDVVFMTKSAVFYLPGPADPKGPWQAYRVGTDKLRSGGNLGDLDGDGDLDIIWGNAWYEHPADPTVTPWPVHPIDAQWPTEARATTADLNGDGRLDVLLSGEESAAGVAWFENPADPRAGPWPRHDIVRQGYQQIHSLQVADFDRDGDLDVFAAEMHTSKDPDYVTIFENVSAPADQWVEHVVDTTGSHNAKVGDLNGDGYPDIVGKNYEAGAQPLQVDVWFNELGSLPPASAPTATDSTAATEPPAATESAVASAAPLPVDRWQRHIIDPDRPWRAIFITGGDINGDRLPDIIAGGWWYQNPGTPGGAWTRHEIGGELYNMAAVYDFDGDGDLDILGTSGRESSSTFFWAENDGQGTFTLHDNIAPADGDFLQGVRVAALLPGPGVQVVLSWHNQTSTQMFQVPAPPSGDWQWSEISPTTTGEQVAIGDIDRDGDLDIHLGTVWLRNDGGTWTPIPAVTLGDPKAVPDRVELVDIDGDGDLDVVIGAEDVNRLVWGEAPADPTQPWTEHVISTDSLAMSMDVGDLDQDGDPDIVVGEHTSSGKLWVFQNEDHGQQWTATAIDSGFEHHDGARLVDIDGDGDLDIVSTGWFNHEIALFENLAIGGGESASAAPQAPTPTPPAAEAPSATPELPPPGARLEGRITDGLAALYTFQEGRGDVIHDVSGNGAPLDLKIGHLGDVRWDSGGLVLGSTLVESTAPAARIAQACQAANEITLEAWIQSGSDAPDAAANIVTLSESATSRSFTLLADTGAGGPYYEARLRTTQTAPDGTPSLSSAPGTASSERQHVVFTRDASGTTRLYVSGIPQAEGSAAGDFSAWNPAFRLGLGNEFTGKHQWRGTYFLVAIYCRALTPEEVQQNFVAGMGQ